MSTLNDNDVFLVQQNGKTKTVLNTNRSTLDPDNDFFLVQRSGVIHTIKAGDVGGAGNASFLMPPFSSISTLETTFTSLDGKLEFSLDLITWQTTLTVPLNTAYHVRWDEGINNAATGSSYETQVDIDFPNIDSQQTIDYKISSIDRVPDQFEYEPQEDCVANEWYEANYISPLGTINAPSQIWCVTDADEVQVNINDTGWVVPPVAPGDLRVDPFDQVRLKHQNGSSPATVYTSTLSIGYGTDSGEFTSGDFKTTTKAIVVTQPVIDPVPDGYGQTRDGVVTSSPFESLDTPTQTHGSSSWELYGDINLENLLDSSIDDTTNLVRWRSEVDLVNVGTYYYRVKYTDSNGSESEWSDPIAVDCTVPFLWQIRIEGSGHMGSNGRNRNNNDQIGAGIPNPLRYYLWSNYRYNFIPGSATWAVANGQNGWNKGGDSQRFDENKYSGAGGGSTGVAIDGVLASIFAGSGGAAAVRGDGNKGNGGNTKRCGNGDGGGGSAKDGIAGGAGGVVTGIPEAGTTGKRGNEAAGGGGGAGAGGGKGGETASGDGRAGGGGGGAMWMYGFDETLTEDWTRGRNVDGAGGSNPCESLTFYNAGTLKMDFIRETTENHSTSKTPGTKVHTRSFARGSSGTEALSDLINPDFVVTALYDEVTQETINNEQEGS